MGERVISSWWVPAAVATLEPVDWCAPLGRAGKEEDDLLGARGVDVDRIIQGATSPEVAAGIYSASLLAIQVDSPAERAYLAMLAAWLRLPDELVMRIHEQVDQQRVTASVSSDTTVGTEL